MTFCMAAAGDVTRLCGPIALDDGADAAQEALIKIFTGIGQLWCWMQSRFLLCGMAAAPDPGGTRFGFLGGIRAPGVTLLHPLLHLIGPAAVRLDRLEADVRRNLLTG